jgi:hypothetical protein
MLFSLKYFSNSISLDTSCMLMTYFSSDTQLSSIHDVLQEFNTINPKLKFTLEEEENNRLNFLDISILRNHISNNFNIFRKPTATDTLIHSTSHPEELKMSAIRFLKHRNSTYLTHENKQQETKVTIHILWANQYRTTYGERNKVNHQNNDTNNQNVCQVHVCKKGGPICHKPIQIYQHMNCVHHSQQWETTISYTSRPTIRYIYQECST